jgi:flagellin-like protein
MMRDSTGVSPVIATILLIAITVVAVGVVIAFVAALPKPTSPLATSITIGGATASSTTLTITHAGGDQIKTAFYANSSSQYSYIAANNWANMEVRVNGANVATVDNGATLNNAHLTPSTSYDFSVGNILVLPFATPLAPGDVITVIYTPANQILATVTVP